METTAAPTATRLQILCATHGEKHIECIGGRNPDGSLWTMTWEKAIEAIDAKTLEFFVHQVVDLEVVDVKVVNDQGGEYLRTLGTKAEKILADNLRYLPKCPSS